MEKRPIIYILTIALMISTNTPLTAAEPRSFTKNLQQRMKSFSQAVTDFKVLYRKCRRPEGCSPEEKRQLRIQIGGIATIGTTIFLVLAGAAFKMFRRKSSKKQEVVIEYKTSPRPTTKVTSPKGHETLQRHAQWTREQQGITQGLGVGDVLEGPELEARRIRQQKLAERKREEEEEQRQKKEILRLEREKVELENKAKKIEQELEEAGRMARARARVEQFNRRNIPGARAQ